MLKVSIIISVQRLDEVEHYFSENPADKNLFKVRKITLEQRSVWEMDCVNNASMDYFLLSPVATYR